jgi:hypothetical protein
MFEPVSQELRGERSGPAQRIDDQLYGKLLEVNAALKDAGGVLIIVYALVLLTAYLALWFGWYKSLVLLQGADLNVVWIYLIVFVVVFFVWIAHFELLQWWCYRRNRPELLDHIQRAALNRYDLLARIADDKSVANVAEVLKRDRWTETSHRFYVNGAG